MSVEEQVDETLLNLAVSGVAYNDKTKQTGITKFALESAKHQILELIKQARIDELERFKLNRSHNKGELELINNRLKQLTEDK